MTGKKAGNLDEESLVKSCVTPRKTATEIFGAPDAGEWKGWYGRMDVGKE